MKPQAILPGRKACVDTDRRHIPSPSIGAKNAGGNRGILVGPSIPALRLPALASRALRRRLDFPPILRACLSVSLSEAPGEPGLHRVLERPIRRGPAGIR